MPQLVKGGKWVFGWTIVGKNSELAVPLTAFVEYGFQPRETVFILRGSRSSGGFSIGRSEKLDGSPLHCRIIGQSTIDDDGRLKLPAVVSILQGESLLVVRGSGLALGFLRHGLVYEEALLHPEIEVFSVDEFEQ